MHIKITANTLTDGTLDWDMDGKKPHQCSHEFKPKSGSHDVTFKLDDDTGRDLRFDCRHPFSEHKTETRACPPDGSKSDQIEVIACSPNELTVSNANSGDACTIQYKLSFLDKKRDAVEIDPEFKNGGGS